MARSLHAASLVGSLSCWLLTACGSSDGRELYEPFEFPGGSEHVLLDGQNAADERPPALGAAPPPEGGEEPGGSASGELPSTAADPTAAEQHPEMAAGGDDAAGPVPAPDVEPPRVTSTSPGDGEVGVRSDAIITIQFSEPMQRQATEGALALPFDAVLAWSDDDTQLQITPAGGLAYATGPEPLAAASYVVDLGPGAVDRAGNALEPTRFSFATLRRVELRLRPVASSELTATWRADAAPPSGDCEDELLCVGEQSAKDADRDDEDEDEDSPEVQHKAFLSFDLSALPAELVALDAARLEVEADSSRGDPFDGLGALHVERAEFERVDQAAFDADPDATLGVLHDEDGSVTSDDIRWVIEADLADRRLSQYRLVFPQVRDGDADSDLVLFAPRDQVLLIAYLLP